MMMNNRRINRNLPYTVTFVVNEKKIVKRFSDPKEAWGCMAKNNGTLNFGFRVLTGA